MRRASWLKQSTERSYKSSCKCIVWIILYLRPRWAGFGRQKRFGCLVPHLSGEGCEVLCQLLLLLLLLRLLPAPDGSVPHRISTANSQWQCSYPSGPQPQTPNGSVPYLTSTASSGWQCSPPELNRKPRMAVFPPGPQPPAHDGSVLYRIYMSDGMQNLCQIGCQYM